MVKKYDEDHKTSALNMGREAEVFGPPIEHGPVLESEIYLIERKPQAIRGLVEKIFHTDDGNDDEENQNNLGWFNNITEALVVITDVHNKLLKKRRFG